jgi:hypothetical protein
MKHTNWAIIGTRLSLCKIKMSTGLISLLLCFAFIRLSAQSIRKDVILNDNWLTAENDSNKNAYPGFEKAIYNDHGWLKVNVPHNWDDYGGYRRLKHGNRHGYAWYRKTFTVEKQKGNKRYFLWFEGVGSYATVWLNGVKVGYHAGGRTSFTLDVTKAIKPGAANVLCVEADHPAFIKDLPWVCGGCSDDPGFSEGSQPMGIFRPVHLIVTNAVRVEPFGVHVWNDTTVSERAATLNLETELKNYDNIAVRANVISELHDATGKVVAATQSTENLAPGKAFVIPQILKNLHNVHLWSLENPYLYRLITRITVNGKTIDQITTPYGIRWISWPIGRAGSDNRFYLNGKPVFINGIAEYEHLMGKSQAFTHAEIRARVMQLRAAGFNAFRDAHQPHNLEYQKYWDELGVLWWPQYSAHIWYDTPQFREEFKNLLRDWVKERRNSPSVILWGLQNESHLPEGFAKECSAIIRELDPTASSQRKITTCNGGRGTDWDVPQNWTGTYGGNPLTYGEDLQKQLLVGEYGAWRSLDLHTSGPFAQTGILSEDRMAQLMETKVRLAESVKDKVAGHFQWLLYSHENPGRTQGGEGYRELDRVGPINYKGLFTPWGQPLDVFYMYRANYAPKQTQPMVYIVSHTWPNRWLTPGLKDSITVYSNCDEVELFNDVKTVSLGRQKRGATGTHFQWNKVDIKYNVLYAVGYVNGREVAHDYVVLNHLPHAPHLNQILSSDKSILEPAKGYQYLYRVNCGGPDYQDSYGNTWSADRHWENGHPYGSTSWTDDYNGMPAFFASQQRTFDPVAGTADSKLFQTFRYGMQKLKYEFAVPDGDYRVELYFNEPWYGEGGGMDCAGWRVFDVALNGQPVLKNLDIWKEVGYNKALKKVVNAHVTGGKLVVSFPQTAAGEEIISAISISSLNRHTKVSNVSQNILTINGGNNLTIQSWLDIGDKVYTDADIRFAELPPVLFGADWIKTAQGSNHKPVTFKTNKDCNIYIGAEGAPTWLKDYEVTGLTLKTDENGGRTFNLYRKIFPKNAVVKIGSEADHNSFLIAALPVTHMEPATDLRRTISYKADNAILSGTGIGTDTLAGKKVVRIGEGAKGTVAFNIAPGVADTYAIRIKYYNNTQQTFTAKMELSAADGTIMKSEMLKFKPVQKNKSGTVATTTGTSINAGNYKVILTPTEANGLVISAIEIQ